MSLERFIRARTLLGALLLSLTSVTPAVAGSLDVPVRGAGLSIGNSRTFTGLRLNARDHDLQAIRGVSVTLWAPGDSPGGRIQGLSLGLLGTAAEEIDGVTLNLLGCGADRQRGIAVGGLGIGADDFAGIGLGGLGIGGDRLTGVMVGGLGVGGDTLTGLFVGGLGVGGDELTGAALAIGGVGADRITGLAACGAYLRGGTLDGFGAGAYNRFDDGVEGIQIGIFNYAAELHGVQLGLLNYAGNNRRGTRWLPLVNMHLGD